jgi:HK97 family phage prohead protease
VQTGSREVTKHLSATVEKSDGDFDARFVLSAATPDRVRDTIEPSAYTAALRMDKLIALMNHDPDKIIGYWTNLETKADTLRGHLKLASTRLGDMLRELLVSGVPLGASIGFRGKGEPNKAGGVHFKEIELLECSLVATPAHPRAMQIAKHFGIDLGVESDPTPADTLQRAKRAILSAQRTIRN